MGLSHCRSSPGAWKRARRGVSGGWRLRASSRRRFPATRGTCASDTANLVCSSAAPCPWLGQASIRLDARAGHAHNEPVALPSATHACNHTLSPFGRTGRVSSSYAGSEGKSVARKAARVLRVSPWRRRPTRKLAAAASARACAGPALGLPQTEHPRGLHSLPRPAQRRGCPATISRHRKHLDGPSAP